ncbi:GAP family protein [Hoyosella altamirensis]|uniref:Cytochrome c biogenesis protein CcdA n=1 Tax=Hoyosella altamirensis TaxID=616997 RepID=A0A839RP34_9ACTN|nr:GAP family protein [Hoyosella altamirensis]MBB3037894.1 cytochrome c biogenesis protein CcdA [Hoyosella altamirensis]
MSPDVVLPVFGLALLDTMSPAVLGIGLFVLLSGRKRIGRPLLAFLATVALFYFAVGVALMLGLDAVLANVDAVAENRGVLWGQAGAGAALIGYSFLPKHFRTFRRRERQEPMELRTPVMISLGLGAGLMEVGMVLPYLAAIGIMTAADLSAAQWLPLVAGYNLIMVAPPLLMYAGYRLARERIEPQLRRWHERLRAKSGETHLWIAGIVGVLLLVNALQKLF